MPALSAACIRLVSASGSLDESTALSRFAETCTIEATLKDEMNHPEIAKIGVGNVDPERLKKSIDILVDANGLPRTPTVAEIFTSAFLPDMNDLPKTLF